MFTWRNPAVVALVASLMALGGCDVGGSASGERSTVSRVPAQVRDLDQVCADGRGFPGLPAYSPKKGAKHRVAHLWSDERDRDIWVAKSSDTRVLPKSVFVDDKGDARVVDAVLCQERVSAVSTGKTCKLTESGNGKRLTVTLYSATYRLRLREARTGKVVVDDSVKARATRCPIVHAYFDEALRDKDISPPREKDVNAVVRRYVTG